MMKKGTIVVEEHEDPFLRTYHLTEDMCPGKTGGTFERPFVRETSTRCMGELGFPGSEVVAYVSKIPGIKTIWISSYDITVKIGKGFLWGDEGDRGKEKKSYSPSSIHCQILDILCRVVFFYPDGMMEAVAYFPLNIVEDKDAESRLSGLRPKSVNEEIKK